MMELNGAMVHTERNGQRGWHEAKIGSVYRWTSRLVSPRRCRRGSVPGDFCLGFESREQFLHRLYAHTVGLRLGAPGQSAKYFHLPGKTVTELFDFFHATEPVWTVWPHAVWPEDPTAAKTWSDQACHGLRYGGWERLEAALRTAFVPPE